MDSQVTDVINVQQATPVFFDTEFTGLHAHPKLISIAFVYRGTNDERMTFYAESSDWSEQHCEPFVIDHILPVLGDPAKRLGRNELRLAVYNFLAAVPGTVHLWGDTCFIDSMLLFNLLGGAAGFPPNVHYQIFDLTTLLFATRLNPDLTRHDVVNVQGEPLHHALTDAKVCAEIWRLVMSERLSKMHHSWDQAEQKIKAVRDTATVQRITKSKR